ncbi:amino acid ABC transporter ATP-binding protein [Verrucomicrobiales bacterium BCK34]|nr:amino acid ABC transporter ATP-binding protein [Verrucomicrobiales bacterium BCK34]
MSIEINELSKRYGATQAVDSVTAKFGDDDQVVALIGPSGGGKSTLLRLLGGLESPDSGSVILDGASVPAEEEALRQFRMGNGFLFQSFNLFPHLKAIENISLPLVKVHGWTVDDARDRAREIADRFGLVEHLEKSPAQLSGGQQQRIALARAVAHRPGLLFLDEPTSALDPEMKAEVLDLIEELRLSGQRIVLSTHEMGFAKRSSHKVLFLSGGRCLEMGESNAVFENPVSKELRDFLAKVMKW